jgi:hypothetical protein
MATEIGSFWLPSCVSLQLVALNVTRYVVTSAFVFNHSSIRTTFLSSLVTMSAPAHACSRPNEVATSVARIGLRLHGTTAPRFYNTRPVGIRHQTPDRFFAAHVRSDYLSPAQPRFFHTF